MGSKAKFSSYFLFGAQGLELIRSGTNGAECWQFRVWRSGGSSVVVSKQSTRTFAAFDAARRVPDFVSRIDQQVFHALMISLLVIMPFAFRVFPTVWSLTVCQTLTRAP